MTAQLLTPDDWFLILGTPDEAALDDWLRTVAGFNTRDRQITQGVYDSETRSLTLTVTVEPFTIRGDEFVTETLTFMAPSDPPCWPQLERAEVGTP